MKARFLIAAGALGALAVPALANAPDDAATSRSNGQQIQPSPGRYSGGSYGNLAPFGTREQSQSDMRAFDRAHNNLVPPRKDASGVPDPRV